MSVVGGWTAIISAIMGWKSCGVAHWSMIIMKIVLVLGGLVRSRLLGRMGGGRCRNMARIFHDGLNLWVCFYSMDWVGMMVCLFAWGYYMIDICALMGLYLSVCYDCGSDVMELVVLDG